MLQDLTAQAMSTVGHSSNRWQAEDGSEADQKRLRSDASRTAVEAVAQDTSADSSHTTQELLVEKEALAAQAMALLSEQEIAAADSCTEVCTCMGDKHAFVVLDLHDQGRPPLPALHASNAGIVAQKSWSQ